MSAWSLPVPTPDSEEFWRGCAQGELRMQRCRTCGELNWFPRGICAVCSSTELAWEKLTGLATVYSYSVVSRPASDSVSQYVLALVDLAEGPRLLTHLVGLPAESIRIGMPVTVCFEQRSDDISLPMFTPPGHSHTAFRPLRTPFHP
jgi:uncharacterized protein